MELIALINKKRWSWVLTLLSEKETNKKSENMCSLIANKTIFYYPVFC